MVDVGILFALLVFAVWIYAIFDVVTADDGVIRTLPKLLWLIIVLLLPDLGSLAWFLAGRPRRARTATPRPAPAYERLDGTVAGDDDEFRRQARARVEEQRRRYREGRYPDR